jgi:hypothetical protein
MLAAISGIAAAQTTWSEFIGSAPAPTLPFGTTDKIGMVQSGPSGYQAKGLPPANLVAGLYLATIIGAKATGWTNTGLATNTEICLVSIPYPPLGPNDQMRFETLWNTGGSPASNDKRLTIRFTAGGPACTLGAANTTGSLIMNMDLNSSSTTALDSTNTIANAAATNAQVERAVGAPAGVTSSSPTTLSVETKNGGWINFDCNTVNSTSDMCQLLRYTVTLIPGK